MGKKYFDKILMMLLTILGFLIFNLFLDFILLLIFFKPIDEEAIIGINKVNIEKKDPCTITKYGNIVFSSEFEIKK
jgi:hypothetical protein